MFNCIVDFFIFKAFVVTGRTGSVQVQQGLWHIVSNLEGPPNLKKIKIKKTYTYDQYPSLNVLFRR